MADRGMVLGIAGIALGLILYLGSVAGLWTDSAVSPVDVGLLSTTLVFVLMGVVGFLMRRADTQAA